MLGSPYERHRDRARKSLLIRSQRLFLGSAGKGQRTRMRQSSTAPVVLNRRGLSQDLSLIRPKESMLAVDTAWKGK